MISGSKAARANLYHHDRRTGRYASVTGHGWRISIAGGNDSTWQARLVGKAQSPDGAWQKIAITITGKLHGRFVLKPLQRGYLEQTPVAIARLGRDNAQSSINWADVNAARETGDERLFVRRRVVAEITRFSRLL